MQQGFGKIMIFIILGLIFWGLTQCENLPAKQVARNIQPLTNSWEKVVPHQEIPQGLTSLSAKQCGICHQKHYEEWKLSTHAHAWTDLQFQAELKKESSPFMCINCHIPLENQQEYLIKGLIDGDVYQPVKEKNPRFDEKLQQEGITCVACHVRNNAIIGTTGTTKAPHKTIKDPDFLSEKLCISCHNTNVTITDELVCTFQTGDEWKAGPYSNSKNCISCHMDTIRRAMVHGFDEKTNHFHYFPGSGIPKVDTATTKMLNGLSFSPSFPKKQYAVNEAIIFSLKLKNEFAGHRVPTGDPERFFLISYELKDEAGKLIASQIDRIGEEWEWYPVAKKIADNNLNPGEERIFTFSKKVSQKGKFHLFVKVSKHRMTKETAVYNKLGAAYPLSVVIFEESYVLRIK